MKRENDGLAVDGEVACLAPAKVNLYLHVVGRRADGYHLLDSLVVFAGVGDRIAVAPAADLSLTVDGPFADRVPAGSDNLVLRAARALAEKSEGRRGARIRLTKRLPIAAGIGGGSADAAATLRALCALWRIALDPAEMAALALKLGADVPVCLVGTPALVGGIGEDIAPSPTLPAVWMVLVNPGVAVSTPAIFRARRGVFSQPRDFGGDLPNAAALFERLARWRNDLAEAALAQAPVIAEVLAALAARPGCGLTRMSGSGATCFGLFAEEAAALAAAAAISADHGGWWVAPAPVLASAVEVSV